MLLAEADALKTADALRPLIESEAEAIEAASTMTEPVVDALTEAGLFRLATPAAYGGVEAGIGTLIDVCESLSFADGSVGWAFAQNITVGAYAAYLAPEIARDFAATRTAAGMFAPMGVATPEDGGYRVQGHFRFGSGSGHADWVGGAATALVDGQPAPMPNDAPPILAFVLPKDRVVMKGNWDVMGLRGTGSYDYEVPPQFVEAGACFPLFAAETLEGGPIYGIGALTFGVAGSAGWALGTARRALHEIVEIARAGRTRLGSQPLYDQPGFHREYGFHLSALRSVSLLVHDSFRTIVAACERGAPYPERMALVKTSMADAAYATRIAKAAVVWAWETSGSHGLRNPNRLQRCFRDIYVGAGHQVFDDRTFIESARQALGIEDPVG